MKTNKGRSLERLHNKAQAKRAAIEAKRLAIAGEDNPFGTPISYTHLSATDLEIAYNNALMSVPTGDDLKDLESLDVQALIQIYTGLLG